MTRFRFITNLRPRTVSSFENSEHCPQGWLLATHRVEAETQELAHTQREEGLDLFADNGTKRLIDVAIKRFKAPLKPLQEEIWALRTSLGDGRRIP